MSATKRDHASIRSSCVEGEGEQSRKMHVRWRYGQPVSAERKVVKEEPKGQKAALLDDIDAMVGCLFQPCMFWGSGFSTACTVLHGVYNDRLAALSKPW